jgi:hypothetical protein
MTTSNKSILERRINILTNICPKDIAKLISEYEYHYRLEGNMYNFTLNENKYPSDILYPLGLSNCPYSVGGIYNGIILTVFDNNGIKLMNPLSKNNDIMFTDHNKEIHCLAMYPDGRIVDGSNDNTVKLWNIKREFERCDNIFTGHTEQVNRIAIYHDGRIVSGSNDCTLKMWNSKINRNLCSYNPINLFRNSINFLRNSKIRYCDVTFVGHTAPITCIAICIDGRIVSGSVDETLKIWNAHTGKCDITLKGHTDTITCVMVHFDGRIISGSLDNTLRIWDPLNGKCDIILKEHAAKIKCIAICPDGKIISGSHDSTLKVWQLEQNKQIGKCIMTLVGHNESVFYVDTLHDGRIISASCDNNNVNMKLWC